MFISQKISTAFHQWKLGSIMEITEIVDEIQTELPTMFHKSSSTTLNVASCRKNHQRNNCNIIALFITSLVFFQNFFCIFDSVICKCHVYKTQKLIVDQSKIRFIYFIILDSIKTSIHIKVV